MPGARVDSGRHYAVLICVVLCYGGWLAFLSTPAYAQPVTTGPLVDVVGLDGQVVRGNLLNVTPEITLATDGGERKLAWTDVLSISPITERPTSTPAPPAGQLRFHLEDGSIFRGEITASEGRELAVRLGGGQTCRLDTMMLRTIRQVDASATAREKLAEVITGHADSDNVDVAVIARDEKIAILRGRVEAITPDIVTFNWNGRSVRVPWRRLVGLVFAESAPRTASCLVRLHSGDVLAGRIVGGTAESLILRSNVFDDQPLYWAEVSRIDCRSDRLVLLSELRPRQYEFEPFFDKHWDYAVDETLTGQAIRLAGKKYASGISMHSRAKLTYDLGGQFQQFAATAGIVDEMRGRGCVTMRVLGDGRVLWEAREVRGGQSPRDVLVNVAGVRELQLVVDFDEDLDLSDQAAWGFARLIRSGVGE
ncbi:MAG: NPCBM/NEW2 domain-containing protein [Planctomycetota bacterium]